MAMHADLSISSDCLLEDRGSFVFAGVELRHSITAM
jgi:hypothetical protein